jgi:hypothetical protein
MSYTTTFSSVRIPQIAPAGLRADGSLVSCTACGAWLFPDESLPGRLTPCCRSGTAIQPPLAPLSVEYDLLLHCAHWPRLCLKANNACSCAAAVVSGPPAAGSSGPGIRVPFAPPCVFRLEGSIRYHMQPLGGAPRPQNPTAGVLSRAACSWWLSGLPLPSTLEISLQSIIQNARHVLLGVHPGATFAVSRECAVLQHTRL